MSGPDNDLKKALAENGSFDPEKAEETKQKAVGTFEAAMKKVERYLRLYMCLCCWLAVFAGCQFFTATTTKGMLLNGLLVLVFFETIILMKLWYWIMNNKITVLKEIKQLQLGQSPGDADTSLLRAKRLEGPVRGLSRRERTVWWAALIAGVVLVCAVKSHDVPFGPASLTSRSCIALTADGSGSAATEMLVLLEGMGPTESFDFPAPKSAVVRFEDSHGRELPFTTSPEGGDVHYEVRLIDPVPPGRQFSYTQFAEDPNCATEKDGIWTYTNDNTTYGFATNELSAEIALPEGAEIVSATPWPVDRFTMNNRPTVRFEAKRGRNEAFKYTVRYRLPPEAGGQVDNE